MELVSIIVGSVVALIVLVSVTVSYLFTEEQINRFGAFFRSIASIFRAFREERPQQSSANRETLDALTAVALTQLARNNDIRKSGDRMAGQAVAAVKPSAGKAVAVKSSAGIG